VFEPFHRGPGSASSGVGLAIVRAVVHAHGGRVTIADGPTGGTDVDFTLPVHRG
jgi:signal transduction histidine kinase